MPQFGGCARVFESRFPVVASKPVLRLISRRMMGRVGPKLPTALAFAAPILFCIGCEAPVRIQPGFSALRVAVRAKPKAGYVAPSSGSPSDDPYGFRSTPDGGTEEAGPFERVDYDHLGDIVVWLEPAAGATMPSPPSPPQADIAFGGPPSAETPLAVTCVGGRIIVHNRGATAETIYSLSPANEFDLGPVEPGGAKEHLAKSPGVIELLSESRNNPVGQVYVAPSPWVKRSRSGERVVFNDLVPGRYRVITWHPRLPGSQTEVTLTADELGRTQVFVGVDAMPMSR